ncbi:response regulator transcription factor [Marinospirillum perlucidum]|uniref:response regulator transcription factor n=1 Tax=Marinospirillum perlucidum TaxID=1982602 RepID=UPI000DF17720|nr:response regulator transcription factor [Marinospirillum perlucidum]
MPQVAIIEDDQDQARLLASWLHNYGYQATLFVSAEIFRDSYQPEKFDLLLIDWLLPGMSGLQLMKKLADDPERPPTIFLTSLDGEDDLAEALHSGADDFISKPINKTILMARIRAVTRRAQASNSKNRNFEPLELDAAHFQLGFAGQKQRLTPAEFRLMQLFVHSESTLFSREELADSIWGDVHKAQEGRALDLLISRLRKKLAAFDPSPGQVVSHYGQGYAFQRA